MNVNDINWSKVAEALVAEIDFSMWKDLYMGDWYDFPELVRKRDVFAALAKRAALGDV